MLVRCYGVAGKDGDANQRVVVGDYGSGCGSQPGSDDANRAGMRSVGAAIKRYAERANRGLITSG